MLQTIYTEHLSAQEIMDLDKKMLDEMGDTSDPVLHFYQWPRPSVTYGYFIDPKKYLKMDSIKNLNIDIARRPTGGGIVFHLWDMAFSFLLPSNHKKFSLNTLDNYFFVNSCVLSSVNDFLNVKDVPHGYSFSDLDLFNEMTIQNEQLPLVSENFSDSNRTIEKKGDMVNNFCMARPTKFDVIVKGKKVAGAAQRRTKKGYLHQGTIALVPPDRKILQDVLLDTKTISDMNVNTFPLFQSNIFVSFEKKAELKNLLISHLEKNLF